jgi:Tol biopolymer transport system component
MRGAALASLACAACLSKPSSLIGRDGGTRADAPACTLGSWGMPAEVPGINTPYDDRGPWLSPDGLDLYFVRTTTPVYIQHAHRPDASVFAFFSGATPLTELPTFYGADPALSDDQTRIYFACQDTTGNVHLDMATRADANSTFGAAAPIMELDTGAYNQNPALLAGETTMFYASDRGGNSIDLYVTTRDRVGTTWNTPAALAALASPDADYEPTISADGSDLLFVSGSSLLEAHHEGAQPNGFVLDGPFLPTGNLTVYEPFLSRDGTTLVFTTPTMSNGFDLWYMQRPCQ